MSDSESNNGDNDPPPPPHRGPRLRLIALPLHGKSPLSQIIQTTVPAGSAESVSAAFFCRPPTYTWKKQQNNIVQVQPEPKSSPTPPDMDNVVYDRSLFLELEEKKEKKNFKPVPKSSSPTATTPLTVVVSVYDRSLFQELEEKFEQFGSEKKHKDKKKKKDRSNAAADPVHPLARQKCYDRAFFVRVEERHTQLEWMRRANWQLDRRILERIPATDRTGGYGYQQYTDGKHLKVIGGREYNNGNGHIGGREYNNGNCHFFRERPVQMADAKGRFKCKHGR